MRSTDDVAAIGRDPDALEVFYRQHIEAVQRFVARRVDSPEDAADLTAEVFLAAIHASRDYRGDAAVPRAWLYGIARRVVAGHHRSGARALRALPRIDARELLDDDAENRIVARIDSQRAAREVYRSLAALPERQRAGCHLPPAEAGVCAGTVHVSRSDPVGHGGFDGHAAATGDPAARHRARR